MKRSLGVVALLALAFAARAQSPSADWRTIETPHFRVHFPAEYEEWSTRAASRLEAVREAVVKEVGYEPSQVIDVMVVNPAAAPNGYAWPFLDAPRVVLFTQAPGPDEQIGGFSNWIDLLTVHEVTHIVHMLRPSRNPTRHLVERFVFSLNPITIGSPRWVLEGYATVIEGRLTGAGRPNSSLRAIVLRKWAASGRLPSYGQLDSDNRFLGMSMAYLAGSAFLEWLEARSGPDSLRHLWRRLTARQQRSFDDAFIGVFGDSPQRLYGEFAAELTASAIAVNRATPLREGELWQETTRASGDPAVSPDGSLIAVVVRERSKPATLRVWSTGPQEEEERKFQKRIARILERDPDDVAPIRRRPHERKAIHSLTMADGGDIESPRWTRDGKSIIYSHRQPDAEGFFHYDLFRWTPDSGLRERLTHLEDVREADPFPDSNRAIAVRDRVGFSQLVIVNFESGEVHAVTEPSIEHVYSHPRVHRDGKRIAYVVNDNGRWMLRECEALDCGRSRPLSTPVGDASSPEWLGDEIVATFARGGFAEIYRDGRPITRSSGGAFQPAPSIDGRVFFMGLEPDGFVVRVINGALQSSAEAGVPFDRALVPAIPPEPPQPVRFESAAPGPSRPYGIGRQELSWLIGEQHAASQSAIELGVRAGDVVGRLDTLAIGSFGRKNGWRGAAIATAWRGWPVAMSAHLFSAKDDRIERNGLEVRGWWSRIEPRTEITIEGGALSGKPFDIGFIRASLQAKQILGNWRVDEAVHLRAEGGSFEHGGAMVDFNLRRNRSRIGVKLRRDYTRDEPMDLGGLPSSIVPDSAFATTVFEPAFASGTMRGTRYEGIRFEVTTPLLPATLFYQQHRIERRDMSLAGLELAVTGDAMPVLRLPAFDFTAGVARVLDYALRGKTRWWFGLRWRP